MGDVVVLDYGSGNLRSAQRALERVGAAKDTVTVTADLDAARRADGLVIPGVGAYAACMAGIKRVGAAPVIADRVAAGAPVLGICVGMQVLFDRGEEHGEVTRGLGVLAGAVTRLRAPVLPHMGWNTVSSPPETALFAGLSGAWFYFVHSYAAHTAPGLVSTAEHGSVFAAAVEAGPVCATQFHPEKSGDAGTHLLENWVATL